MVKFYFHRKGLFIEKELFYPQFFVHSWKTFILMKGNVIRQLLITKSYYES